MAGVNTSGWEHANWREAATAELRLAALLQHMTEVSLAVVEQSHTHGRGQRMNVNYLAMLEQQEEKLRAAINMAAAVSGNSPVVARPQF